MEKSPGGLVVSCESYGEGPGGLVVGFNQLVIYYFIYIRYLFMFTKKILKYLMKLF